MLSIPKFLIRIKREKRWLKAFLHRERPDLIISDNRYGLWSRDVFCVFVTHQLHIRTPFGRVGDLMLQQMNYHFIRRFSQCWVVDVEGSGLAGELSHPAIFPPIPLRYIGWLSRFGAGDGAERSGDAPGMDAAGRLSKPGSNDEAQPGARSGTGGSDYILVLLSGPEPQRTLLERRIIEQSAGCPRRIVLVRGLPEGGAAIEGLPEGMVVYDHLPATDLERVIRQAAFVIARPGYSTVMDLVRLEKRAVLIPTPGQSEQEYLGNRLAANGWAACMTQRKFSMTAAVAAAGAFSFGSLHQKDRGQLGIAVEEALANCG